MSGRAAVELWSGHLEEAARVLEAGLAAEATTGRDAERADWAGQLALAEALRGRLSHAAELASEAVPVLGERLAARPAPGRHTTRRARLGAPGTQRADRGAQLPQAGGRRAGRKPGQADRDGGLSGRGGRCPGRRPCRGGRPDRHEGTVRMAGPGVARPPAEPGRVASVGGGGRRPRRAGRGRTRPGASPEAAVTLAHARAVAGEGDDAARVLAPVLADCSRLPEPVRLHAWLTDARLHYASGDGVRGRRTLVSALRLAEREQLRLPLVLERGWLGPVLRRDPDLADAHRRLLAPVSARAAPGPGRAPRIGSGAGGGAAHRTRAGGAHACVGHAEHGRGGQRDVHFGQHGKGHTCGTSTASCRRRTATRRSAGPASSSSSERARWIAGVSSRQAGTGRSCRAGRPFPPAGR